MINFKSLSNWFENKEQKMFDYEICSISDQSRVSEECQWNRKWKSVDETELNCFISLKFFFI